MSKTLHLLIVILLITLSLPAVASGATDDQQSSGQEAPRTIAKKVKKTPSKRGKKVVKTPEKAASQHKKKTAKAAAKTVAKPQERPKEAAGQVEESTTPALVTELRHWSNPDYTRIAITLDREARYEYHRLPPNRERDVPPRLYIDIDGAKVGPGVKDLHIGDGLLKSARVGQFRSDTVRIVLDLDTMKDIKIFTFADPFRIIVDARGERPTEISRGKEASLEPLPAEPTGKPVPAEERAPAPAARPAIGKIRRIVVDAGHGGHDPGAMGAGGTKEKDVVLQIALKLARKLHEEIGLDVVLTRSTDVFLELPERTAIANKVGADLFVSIHANAALNRSMSGIETYYLNLAKTEKVAQLAAKENGTSLEKVSLLQAVLFDLMANYKLNDSAHLADEVQKCVCRKVGSRFAGVKNLGVKQGPFYVLVGASMPSILVETSFVSNEREESRLKDPDYQDALAQGVVDGIRGYITSLK